MLEVADAILAGTLDDAAGAPIPGARIEVVGGAADGRGTVVATDGTFTLDMLPRGHLRVRVSHPDYPTDELDDGRVVDRRSRAPASSRSVARSRARSLDAATRRSAREHDDRPASGPGGATAETSTDKPGTGKLGPLRPGHWKLAVHQPGYLATARELDVPASHAPGAASVRDVRIDLARGALLGGTVRDASRPAPAPARTSPCARRRHGHRRG